MGWVMNNPWEIRSVVEFVFHLGGVGGHDIIYK